jgi:hypothetical protein
MERSIIAENFMTVTFTVSEKMEKQFLHYTTPYIITGSAFLKII